MSDTLRVLTVRQPWAGAIVHLGKDIENRPQRWSYRGPVLIHAGLYKPGDADWMEADEYSGVEPKDWRTLPMNYGQIIGITEIVAYVTNHTLECAAKHSPWFTGPFGYVLRHTQPLTPTPYKGGQGLRKFRFDEEASWGFRHDEIDMALQEMGYTSRNVLDGDGLVWEWTRSAA